MNHSHSYAIYIKWILAVSIIAMLIALYMINLQEKNRETGQGSVKAFEHIPLDKLHTILLSNRYGNLTLERNGNQWMIKERESYPAHTLRVNEMIAALADLTFTQSVPAKQGEWQYLGVLDPAIQHSLEQEEFTGNKIEFIGTDYREGLIVGQLQSSNSQAARVFGNEYDGRQFVRLLKDDSIHMADRSLNYLNTLAANWLDPTWTGHGQNKQIIYYKDQQKIWHVSRSKTDIAYKLIDNHHESSQHKDSRSGEIKHIPLPKSSQTLDYAFSSVLVRDVITGDAIKKQVDHSHYFEITRFDGEQYKIILGGKHPADKQAAAYNTQATGVMRRSFASWWRHVTLEWPNGRIKGHVNPPFDQSHYLISGILMEQLMISQSELALFERMSPELE